MFGEKSLPLVASFVKRSQSISLCLYPVTFLLSIAGAIWVHSLRWASLKYPWRVLDSDLSSFYSLAQATGQSWFGLTHESLGAPFRADLSLAFIPDDLQIEIIRLLAHITDNPFTAVNLYYLLSFGLSAMSFLFLARQFALSGWVSVALSLSYSWLPYRFIRMNDGHVFLAGYFMLPLGVFVLYRLFEYLKNDLESITPPGKIPRMVFFFGIVLVGSSSAYYGFFFALLTASMVILVPKQKLSISVFFKRVGALSLVALLFILAPILRVLSAQLRGLETVLTRDPAESVQFAGSISRLIIPWGIWLPESFKPMVSRMEYEWNATPLIGAVGVIILFVAIFLKITRHLEIEAFDFLGYLFLWSVIFYTSSGLGVVFAHVVDPSFRAWNRFSIVIMTFCLLALGVVLNKLRIKKSFLGAFSLVIIVSTQLIPLNSSGISLEPDPVSREAFEILEDTARLIQKNLEAGCQVLQLPIMAFPEGGQIGLMGNGYHLWLPLLTEGFHWSYGAPKGSKSGDFWQGLSNEEAVSRAADLDFCAVVLDKRSNTQIAEGGLQRFSNSKDTQLYALYFFR